ncbi:MAG TPA: hypothetical protein VK781_13190, partial [Solirubrobacteraceae bacterium]|nr:hypothetical protein [Solirubrobacteraceae bacterium]
MRLRRRSSSDFAAWRIGVGAFCTVLATATALTQVVGASYALRLGSAIGLLLGALAGFFLFVLERRTQRRDQVAERLTALKTTPDRTGPIRLRDMSPYDLGTDHEAITVVSNGGRPHDYIPRDRDGRLREMLQGARASDSPKMIVLRGPSKAGKSRTLFEAVRSDETLADSFVVAPTSVHTLGQFIESEAALKIPSGPLLLWLDDLERFATG